MGRLMGSSNSNNYGEQIFINKASEYLDDTNIIYWNRQLFGKEFDVCILMPEKGILVVELKGWREENILRIENNDSVIIQTNDGEVSASPQKQARGYRFSIERHIRQNISKFPLVYQMVCLPQVSKLTLGLCPPNCREYISCRIHFTHPLHIALVTKMRCQK